MISQASDLDAGQTARAARDTSAPPTTYKERIGFAFRLHHLLFIAFTIIAGLPIAALALWESNASFQNELDSVHERNLLVARNLTSTISRYVKDVEAACGLAFESGAMTYPVAGLDDLLASLNVIDIFTVAPNGTTEATLAGLSDDPVGDLPPSLLTDLRSLAANTPNRIAISSLYHDPADRPVFYLVKTLPAGRLGVGIITTTYLVSLQQAIAFGDHGYAVIVDANGQVIAHPFKDWVAASRPMSDVPAVAAMKRGKTGVGQFYSPAFNDNMIAGYAEAPETGWGVMVPQPIAELRRRADQINEMASVIAVVSFAGAALMAWLLALYLTRPVRSIAATAEAVLEGNDEVAVPSFDGLVPFEIRRLGAAFNTMLEDLRRRATETRHALHQAETSNASKTQFLTNMSHEIRTPLNGVVGMIELLGLTETSPVQQRYIQTATQSSQSLLRLIDDILDLSRIEAGHLTLERAPFHLPSLIHDVRVLCGDQARVKGLTLQTWLPDSLNVTLVADKHRLLQVITNLLANALKFTAEGGITLRAAIEQQVGTALRIRFEVSDTGIGVSETRQSQIFEAFTQADNSMTRRYGGTGLGLSIARQLCQMMGGEIGVESVVGVGSTFWFTVLMDRQLDAALPATHPNVPPAAPKRPSSAPALTVVPQQAPAQQAQVQQAHASTFVSPASRDFRAALERAGRDTATILLVEDNPANMRVTQALLEALGCHVTTARNGLEGVSAYRDYTFDLVLMDCQMPEMDGYEATRAIRQIEGFERRYTPIVALTAHAMAGSREASLASGMDDQVTKPLTMATLTSKLLEWLVRTEVTATP
jgi:signal transduction histidine kinase/ActR/RegA family two-component response regulator